MIEANPHKYIPFSNRLLTASEDGEYGEYFFHLDALLAPSEGTNVWKHEVAHRISASGVTQFNSFTILRGLISISHTLLLTIATIAREQDIHFENTENKTIGIYSKAQGDANIIMELLRRVKYIEDIFDVTWQAFAPLAEIWAIDFADYVQHKDISKLAPVNTWWLGPLSTPPPTRQRKILRKKKRVFEAMVLQLHDELDFDTNNDYFYRDFDGFQNAMQIVWNMYSSIEHTYARYLLLSSCMSILYLRGNNFIIRNPIDVMHKFISIFQEYSDRPEQIKRALNFDQQSIFHDAFILIPYLRKQLFADIDKRLYNIGGGVEDIGHLVSQQFINLDSNKEDSSSKIADYEVFGANDSLIRLELEDDGGTFHVNPTMLTYAEQLYDRDKKYFVTAVREPRWWHTPILVESLRKAFKHHTPPTCPFRKWKISSPGRNEERKCDNPCIMRDWWEDAEVCDI